MINFHPLEVVDRGSETQLQVGENLNKLTEQDKCQSRLWQFFAFFMLFFL